MRIIKRENKEGRLFWLSSSCMVLAGLAALFHFVPEPAPLPRARRPFVPRIRFAAGMNEGDAADLSIVWSPALIALPSGVIHPVFEKNRVNRVTPLLGAVDAPALFLEKTPAGDDSGHLDARFRDCYACKRVIRLPRLEDEPVFEQVDSNHTGVGMTFSRGLENVSVDWPHFTEDRWAGRDAPWTLTLYIRFDAEGFPVNVFVVSPARDGALNQEAIRMAYRARVAGAEGPCEGYATIFRLSAGGVTDG